MADYQDVLEQDAPSWGSTIGKVALVSAITVTAVVASPFVLGGLGKGLDSMGFHGAGAALESAGAAMGSMLSSIKDKAVATLKGATEHAPTPAAPKLDASADIANPTVSTASMGASSEQTSVVRTHSAAPKKEAPARPDTASHPAGDNPPEEQANDDRVASNTSRASRRSDKSREKHDKNDIRHSADSLYEDTEKQFKDAGKKTYNTAKGVLNAPADVVKGLDDGAHGRTPERHKRNDDDDDFKIKYNGKKHTVREAASSVFRDAEGIVTTPIKVVQGIGDMFSPEGSGSKVRSNAPER